MVNTMPRLPAFDLEITDASDAFTVQVTAAYAMGATEPHDWLSSVWQSHTFYASAFGYSNPQVDALLDAADREPDATKRLARYAEAQRAIIGDVPAVVVRTSKNIFLASHAVKGLALTPQDTIRWRCIGPAERDD